MNYVYILECKDRTLYTGWTNNLEKRVEKHNTGKGAKYTKSRTPVILKYYEKYEPKEEAMRREYEIKQYSRQQKIQLMESFKEE
ncbi:MAG: GIY-YIG nuclease family protein [Firmicutes bacterium]|nr:GIY-YIG nuclease family protein [Bacillota bacterium]